VDVILRDGSTLRLRAPARTDAGALVDFFNHLSERSRYLRFHGARRVDDALVEHFLDPGASDRGALVGLLRDTDGDERVVALAEYARLRDPAVAEVAFTVADDLQGRGAATRLLEQLAARAGSAGIERFVAEVLPDNAAMLAVFRDAELLHFGISLPQEQRVLRLVDEMADPRRLALTDAPPEVAALSAHLDAPRHVPRSSD